MLTSLGLAHFGFDNWKSSLRRYIKDLSEYAEIADVENRNERETIDFEYEDGGEFTALLIDMGYLPSDASVSAGIKYSIEVKTTTRGCGTPFYVSRAQYRNVSYTLPAGEHLFGKRI